VAGAYVRAAVMPRIDFLMAVVRDLLGEAATPDRVQRCVTSIQAQCLFYLPDPFKSMVLTGWQPRTDDELRETAEHITEFSLAGIRAIAGARRGPRVRPR
jgi:hypothetical protein